MKTLSSSSTDDMIVVENDNGNNEKMNGVIASKQGVGKDNTSDRNGEDVVSVSSSSASSSDGEDDTEKTILSSESESSSSSCSSSSSSDIDSVSVTTTESSESGRSSTSGSDSEGEDVTSDADEDADAYVSSSSFSTSTTGLKRRRHGDKAVTTNADAVAVAVAVDDPKTIPTKTTTVPTKTSTRSGTTSKTGAITTETATTSPNNNSSDIDHSYTLLRWLEFVLGCVIFFLPLPLVFVQIVCTTTWEFVDQHTLQVCDFGTRMNIRFDAYLKKFTHHPKDGFMVTTTLWLGLVLPTYFCWEAFTQYQSIQAGQGFLWWRAAVYNIIRIGPQYRHFMFVYVLCHKEAHSYGKLFAEPYNTTLGLKYVYNYFIGFFHGVLPGPFTESHIYNHHKYDNDKDDVYSTGAYPRDSFIEFVRYVYIWFLYALNISSIRKFYQEQRMERVVRSIGGTVYYCGGVLLVYHWVGSFYFVFFYLLYPMIEGNILLAAVNYTWHAFIDPNDHDNDYVNSVTILDGLNFTLSEEYHVVHHQYGGAHWSKNEELYLKHLPDYKKHTATVFQKTNLFVVWGMIVAKDYEALTKLFVQLEDDTSKHLSPQELAQLLKVRLQTTTWKY